MRYMFLYFSLIFLPFINLFETCEYSITCGNNMEACAHKRKSDSSNVFYVSIRQCNLSKDFCNIYDTLTTSNEHLSYCEKHPMKIPSYPGGCCEPLNNNTDYQCIYGHCINGKCVAFYEENKCDVNEDCPLNTFCEDKKCKELKEKGDTCDLSTECKFDLACIDQHCLPIYYHSNGKVIPFPESLFSDQPEHICESGLYYPKKDEKKRRFMYVES